MFGSRNFLFAKGAAAPTIFNFNLFSWGGNSPYGQLGLGDTTNRSSPVQVGALDDWATIDAGNSFTLAVKNGGTLWAWGQNAYKYVLGTGNNTNYSSPKQVGALTNWAKPSAGSDNSACIKTDGTLWAWGQGVYGANGDNSTGTRNSPVQVGSSTNWAEVSSGGQFMLAVDANGKLFSWGKNNLGRLGLGDTTNRSSPVQVGALTNWSKPSAGSNTTNAFSLCTKTDGTLWSWGSNVYGRLGLGNTTNYSSPVQVGALTNWATPAAGSSHSLCVKTDGTLWSWGQSNYGALGLGTVSVRSSPVQIGALTSWVTPAAGNSFSFCTRKDGTLWAWGLNQNYGQLGLNNMTDRNSPVQVGTLTGWSKIAAGNNHAEATKGVPTAAPVSLTVPVVSGTTKVGYPVISDTGTWNNFPTSFTYQWQRGTSDIVGATSSSYTLVTADIGSTLRCVVTATNSFGAASATSANTATISAASQDLWSWGTNSSGQLGLGSFTSYSSPKQVSISNWSAAALSDGGSVATKTDGTLWTWGAGTSGANGQGSTANRNSPVQVGSLTNWSKPTRGGPNSGRGSVLCVKTDGTLWAWGFNQYFGQLGLNDTTNRSSPTQVGALTTWANISTGRYGTLGVTTSGALWGWGYGRAVANGDGFSSPVQIGSLTNWSKSQVFDDHSLNVKTDNTLWVMGNNGFGQLGNGTTTYSGSPIQIGGAVWATPIIGSKIAYFSACVRTDGTLWTWGQGSNGKLGLGNTTNYSSPVQVGALTNWSKLAGGENFMMATKTDGTLWAWGRNNFGQLGLGDTTNRSSPVQVGALTNWSAPVAGYRFGMAITT